MVEVRCHLARFRSYSVSKEGILAFFLVSSWMLSCGLGCSECEVSYLVCLLESGMCPALWFCFAGWFVYVVFYSFSSLRVHHVLSP